MHRAPIPPLTALALAALACSSPVVEVEATWPEVRDVESVLTTNGRVAATKSFEVHAAQAGRVERLLVHQGERVERGQELLRLADSGQAEALARAEARLRGASGRLTSVDSGPAPSRKAVLQAERAKLARSHASASSDLDRLERLAAKGAVARVELEAAVRRAENLAGDLQSVELQLGAPAAQGVREQALAEVDEARSSLTAASRLAAGLRVRSPAAGVVFSLPIAEGEFLQKGGLAARVGNLDTVTARILVDEPDLGRVKLGCTATIRTDAYPEREWNCKVDRLATEIVEFGARRVGEVRCSVRNPDHTLLPNLAIGVRIVAHQVRAVLSIPRVAVVRSADQEYIWIEEGGTATRRQIRTGMKGPVYVEVRDGLDESETVLLPGEEPLSEGLAVRVQMAVGNRG